MTCRSSWWMFQSAPSLVARGNQERAAITGRNAPFQSAPSLVARGNSLSPPGGLLAGNVSIRPQPRGQGKHLTVVDDSGRTGFQSAPSLVARGKGEAVGHD